MTYVNFNHLTPIVTTCGQHAVVVVGIILSYQLYNICLLICDKRINLTLGRVYVHYWYSVMTATCDSFSKDQRVIHPLHQEVVRSPSSPKSSTPKAA